MKKYHFFVFFFIFLFSCNQKGTDTKSSIKIIGENSSSIQAMITLKKDFETKNPNIELDFKPNTFDDAFSKTNQDLANKTALYDVIMQYNFSLSSFVRNDYVYKIDDLLKNTPDSLKSFENYLFPDQWQEVGYYYKDAADPLKGVQKVGYPFAALSVLLMYNKDMFDDEQNKVAFKKRYQADLVVPSTWEEFYKAAEFFTQKDKSTSGVCLAGATGGFLYYEWMNFLFGMKGKIMDKKRGWEGNAESKIYLNSPEGLKALTFYKSLKPFNNGNFSNVEQYEQMKIMKEGKTAMAFVWSDMIFPSLNAEKGFNKSFGFAPIPGPKSIALGGAYFINKATKHPDAAARYIVYLMQPQTQIELAKKGLCSGSKKVYEDKEVRAIPYTDALKASLDRGGVVIEAGPDANMISEVITTYIQKVWNNELTPLQALDQAQGEIDQKRKDIYSKLK